MNAGSASTMAAYDAARRGQQSGRSTEAIEDDMRQAWVRLKLGQNRGEVRSMAPFDTLLDERIATGRPLLPLDTDY